MSRRTDKPTRRHYGHARPRHDTVARQHTHDATSRSEGPGTSSAARAIARAINAKMIAYAVVIALGVAFALTGAP